MRYAPAIAALCLGLGVSCAELDRAACEGGDWRGIGLRDGSRGRPADYIDRHAETCGQYGVAVDAAAWRQGRQQGLQAFCTPQSQYQAGRDGRPFSTVCAAENLPVHRAAYDKGRKYYTLTRRIEDLRAEVSDLRRATADPDDPDRSRAALELEAFMLRMDIDLLLRERRAYAAL